MTDETRATFRVAGWLALLVAVTFLAREFAGAAYPWIERTWPAGGNP